MTRRELLLVSTSTTFGTGYLDHCAEAMLELFSADGRIAFVPYALADRDGYAARAAARFADFGLRLESVHASHDPVRFVERSDGVFIGGGNTFRLLQELYETGLVEPLRRRVASGMPYAGTSAGSNVAGATIRTTNDMPIVEPPSFDALALIPLQVNPHYLDADPDSTHMGETRDQRLAEYLEENERPVVALREGAMLRVSGHTARVVGSPGGKLFRRGREPEDLADGRRLDDLLEPPG